jgi:hypothetical protein
MAAWPNRSLHLTQPRDWFPVLTFASCRLIAIPAGQVNLWFGGGGHSEGSAMRHPEHATVALLSLSFVAVGTLSAFAVGVVFWCNTARLLPSRRSRTAYWVGVAFFALVVLPAVPFTTEVSKAVAVIASLGWDAHSDGLRVVNKHGLLSDGRYLSSIWTAAIVPMMWTMILLVVFVAAGWHIHFHPPRVTAGSGPDGPESRPAEPGAAPDLAHG